MCLTLYKILQKRGKKINVIQATKNKNNLYVGVPALFGNFQRIRCIPHIITYPNNFHNMVSSAQAGTRQRWMVKFTEPRPLKYNTEGWTSERMIKHELERVVNDW